MKYGDYVLIPSFSSEKFSIGQIISERIEDKLLFLDNEPIKDFRKILKVKWHKEARRWNANPHLIGLFNTHQTISNANEYATWIDNLLFDFYFKSGLYHLVLDIKSDEKLNAKGLFRSFLDLFEVADKLCGEFQINENTDDIETRINLNSPGNMELIGKTARSIFLIAAAVIALNGGSAKLKIDKMGINTELSTRGIIESINRFLNSDKDRDLKQHLITQLDKLSISNPEQIKIILKQIDAANQNE